MKIKNHIMIKHLLLLKILLFLTVSYSQSNPVEVNLNNISKDQLRNFNVDDDKFTGETIIKRKGASLNSFQLYITIKENKAYLHVINYYRGAKWLFVEKMIFLIKDEKFTYNVDPKREVLNGGVEEISDMLVTPEIYRLITAMKNVTENVDVRWQGSKGSMDRSIKWKYMYYTNDVLDLFESFAK